MPWASGMAMGYGIGGGLNSIAGANLFLNITGVKIYRIPLTLRGEAQSCNRS